MSLSQKEQLLDVDMNFRRLEAASGTRASGTCHVSRMVTTSGVVIEPAHSRDNEQDARAFGDMPSFYHSVLLQFFYAVGPKVLRSVSHVRLQLAYCQVSTS